MRVDVIGVNRAYIQRQIDEDVVSTRRYHADARIVTDVVLDKVAFTVLPRDGIDDVAHVEILIIIADHLLSDVLNATLRITPAVGNSPPFLTNLPFHDFPKYFNHD